MIRRLLILTAIASSVMIGAVVTPASANTVFLTCTGGSSTANLSPGVTNTPTNQTVTSSGTLTGCSGTAGITSGTSTSSGTAPNASCTPPANGTVTSTGTSTITWNDGSKSSGTYKSKATSNAAQEKVIMKITSGRFAGTSANPTKSKVTIQFSALTGDCTTGITQEKSNNVGNDVIASVH